MSFPTVSGRIVLASRSPQRRMLLGQIVGADRIDVVPPSDPNEPTFGDCRDWNSIEARLRETVLGKLRDVLSQLTVGDGSRETVLAADTVIVAYCGDSPIVLGQPPERDWQDSVREWFREYLLGKTHYAATAIGLIRPGQDADAASVRVVRSEVAFHKDGDRWLEWYIDSGEPLGKAGGYAIQGLGSIFVSSVTGSISNVVGLPQRELLEMLVEAD